jgi:hypothetical protein
VAAEVDDASHHAALLVGQQSTVVHFEGDGLGQAQRAELRRERQSCEWWWRVTPHRSPSAAATRLMRCTRAMFAGDVIDNTSSNESRQCCRMTSPGESGFGSVALMDGISAAGEPVFSSCR